MGTWIEARPKLIIPGVFNSLKDECHITLAYLGDVEHDVAVEKMRQVSEKYYNGNTWPHSTFVSEISGVAEWRDADNKLFRVLLVSPTIPAVSDHSIYSERSYITNKLARTPDPIEVVSTYPFVPHITLPHRYQVDSEERCQHGTTYNALPHLSTRVMFSIDTLYVSSDGEDGTFRNTKL